MMRRAAAAFAILLCSPACALDNPEPDAARQTATVYLDGLAERALASRSIAVAALASKADADKRQAEVRSKILKLIGGLPDRSAPLNAKVTAVHAGDGFKFETVMFESLPGYRVTADLFVPEGKGPFPAVIVSPGHSPSGKLGDYRFAANFARAGFVVLAYDIVGEGERWQHYDPDLNASRLERPTAEHSLAAYQSLLIGQPVVRYFINDAMRGIDYLASRPEVDPQRIGAYGCSGGGAVTAYLAALDPRVKAAASACFVTTMHQLLTSVGPQEGEQSIPGFTSAGLDLADWVELAAPRPYAIVSTTEDMFPFAGAKIVYSEAKRFWKLYGAEDNLAWITGPGRHGALAPIAADIIGFFAKNLNAAGKPAFADLRPADPADVRVTPSGQLSTSAGSKTIQSLVAAEARTLVPEKSTAKHLADAVRAVTAAQSKQSVPVVQTVKTEKRSGYSLQTLRFTPANGPAYDAVLARPDGVVKGRLLYLDRAPVPAVKLERLVKSGWLTLAIIPVGGAGEEIKANVLGDYTLFALRAMLVNRTITGLRIDQAEGAAQWLLRERAERSNVALYGVGSSGPVALQAAALDKRFDFVVVENALAAFRLAVDQPITRNLPEIALPGVLTEYDLPDLMTVPRRVLVINPVDPVGRTIERAAFEKLVAKASNITWLAYAPDDLK
jgi:cephalosporin-C deacetylase-like acetyl esterase